MTLAELGEECGRLQAELFIHPSIHPSIQAELWQDEQHHKGPLDGKAWCTLNLEKRLKVPSLALVPSCRC